MKKANILYICGDNSFAVEKDKNFLINAFKQKYNEANLQINNLSLAQEYANFTQQIQSINMFGEKRMFVFLGGRPTKGGRKKDDNKTEGFENFLENTLPHIDENDILLFYNIAPSEKGLIKWLENNATTRKHNFSWNLADWQKLTPISEKNLKMILNYYESAEKLRDKYDSDPFLSHSIAHTCQYIATLEQVNIPINKEIIEYFSHAYEGQKIFDFIDTILEKNISKALEMSQQFAKQATMNTIDIFVATLIGTLKKYLYILRLRDSGLGSQEIEKTLSGINKFLITKAFKSKLSSNELGCFLEKILQSNIAYKSGKGMKQTILGRFFDIDTSLFVLKK